MAVVPLGEAGLRLALFILAYRKAQRAVVGSSINVVCNRAAHRKTIAIKRADAIVSEV
jgi:hypothetical protein